MAKFGRNYELRVEVADGFVTVQPPFTIDLDITRNDLASANYSTIRVFNLAENRRSQIRKAPNDGIIRAVQLKAGYGENLPIIFNGYIYEAWSQREGVDFITTIQSFDGGEAYFQDPVNLQFPAGTAQRTIIDTLVKQLPGVQPGSVGSYPGNISRGNSYSGNATDLLREVTGGGFFIDNNKAHCLSDSEAIAGDVTVITAESGLLGTPLLQFPKIVIDMIFEPKIIVGQRIFLDSSTASSFNGFYKVVSVHHKAMISPVVCGDAVTSLGLLSGNFEDV